MSKILSFMKKGDSLLKEANIDIINNCFNKAVSAYYFAVEAYANAIFLVKKQKTRGFRSRVAIIRNIFGDETMRKFEKLHDLRRKADHEEHIMNKENANEAKNLSKELINKFRRYLQKQAII